MAGLQFCLQLAMATRLQCTCCVTPLRQIFCTGRRQVPCRQWLTLARNASLCVGIDLVLLLVWSGVYLFFLHFREDAMPFTCALLVAILPLLSTLPPRWRVTCLTQMLMDTQPCTGHPKRVSSPWWNFLWELADLMWKQRIRLAYVFCCLSAFCYHSGCQLLYDTVCIWTTVAGDMTNSCIVW